MIDPDPEFRQFGRMFLWPNFFVSSWQPLSCTSHFVPCLSSDQVVVVLSPYQACIFHDFHRVHSSVGYFTKSHWPSSFLPEERIKNLLWFFFLSTVWYRLQVSELTVFEGRKERWLVETRFWLHSEKGNYLNSHRLSLFELYQALQRKLGPLNASALCLYPSCFAHCLNSLMDSFSTCSA